MVHQRQGSATVGDCKLHGQAQATFAPHTAQETWHGMDPQSHHQYKQVAASSYAYQLVTSTCLGSERA